MRKPLLQRFPHFLVLHCLNTVEHVIHLAADSCFVGTGTIVHSISEKHRYLCSRNLDTAEVENIMLDDVENFIKSVERNPKVCSQKKYTNEETGQEITYIKVKK